MTDTATATAKCDQPAIAVVEIDGKKVPACEKHIAKARARSAKAGKKALPKGLTKAKAAEFVGTNKDDVLPVNVVALTEIEKENAPVCLAHHLEE